MWIQEFQNKGCLYDPVIPAQLTIEEMESVLCDCVTGPEEMEMDFTYEVISHLNITRLKRLQQSKIIDEKFQFKVHKSDKNEYVLTFLDDSGKCLYRSLENGNFRNV